LLEQPGKLTYAAQPVQPSAPHPTFHIPLLNHHAMQLPCPPAQPRLASGGLSGSIGSTGRSPRSKVWTRHGWRVNSRPSKACRWGSVQLAVCRGEAQHAPVDIGANQTLPVHPSSHTAACLPPRLPSHRPFRPPTHLQQRRVLLSGDLKHAAHWVAPVVHDLHIGKARAPASNCWALMLPHCAPQAPHCHAHPPQPTCSAANHQKLTPPHLTALAIPARPQPTT